MKEKEAFYDFTSIREFVKIRKEIGTDPRDLVGYYSEPIADKCGTQIATLIALVFKELDELVSETLSDLSALPQGTHIGEIGLLIDGAYCELVEELPQIFMMYYDYDFLYKFSASLDFLRETLLKEIPKDLCVAEKVILYMLKNRFDAKCIKIGWSDDCKKGSDLFKDLLTDTHIDELFTKMSVHICKVDSPYLLENWFWE